MSKRDAGKTKPSGNCARFKLRSKKEIARKEGISSVEERESNNKRRREEISMTASRARWVSSSFTGKNGQ